MERGHQSTRFVEGEGKPRALEMKPQIDGVGGRHPTLGKPCLGKERQVTLPKTSRQPDIPTFDGTGSAALHRWRFSIKIEELIDNNPQRIVLFESSLVRDASKWFQELPSASIHSFDNL
ncbi:hypothetical protein AAC387_Pa01g2651 [Persea americana]